jgi:choline dehydrogenase-like flavoprotein
LVSSNPFTAPSIDPAFLSTDFDIFTLKEAVKAVKRLVALYAWDGYIAGSTGTPAPPLANTTSTSTDAELEAYVRAGASTVFHPTGTAAMSPKGAHWGVVDPDLKVKGVEGLRIVDGSVLVSIIRVGLGSVLFCFDAMFVVYSRSRQMRIRRDRFIWWVREERTSSRRTMRRE